jgi:hypothetical protein
MVLTAAYRDFYSTIAASAGALTGLLFVAISVAPQRGPDVGPAVIQQVRAAAALVAFSNSLAISVFALVPEGSVRIPAVVAGTVGLLFTAAGTRSIVSSPSTAGRRLQLLGPTAVLLLICGTELVAGTALLADARLSIPLQLISYAVAAALIVGIARAWELVGARDTGIMASLTVLSRHAPSPAPAARVLAADTTDTPESGAKDGEAPGHEQIDREPGERPE